LEIILFSSKGLVGLKVVWVAELYV
jgi:hypothetical protein